MKKNADSAAMSEHAMQRSNIYGFLARAYRKELTPDMLDQLKDSSFTEVFSDMDVKLGDEFFSQPADELLEALAIEYTRLFLGPGSHISPHESIHYERDDGDWGRHWGASTVEVKKFVESLGLKYKETDKSIPDHISVEMEIMQKVIEKEGEAWGKDKGDEALHFLKIEKMFMEDHLDKWVHQFCDKVVSSAELSFYREIAKLTKSFIAFEKDEINKCLSAAKK
jgi:TorA maturation chaperone TorD